MRNQMKATAVACGALALAGCGEPTAPAPDGTSVSLSFAATGGVAAAAPSVSGAGFRAGYSLNDGQNTLVIESAQVVLREIELKRVAGQDCQSGDCEELELDPIVLDVPLDGSTQQAILVDLPEATYREVEFEIHKVSTDPEDDLILASHPHLDGKSIQVEGTWNGTPFTYWTDLDVEQEFDLDPPLVVDGSVAETNVTVRLDLAQWFMTGTGTLVGPDSANKGGPNESLVNENIKQSIEAFEDEDRDGDDLDEM